MGRCKNLRSLKFFWLGVWTIQGPFLSKAQNASSCFSSILNSPVGALPVGCSLTLRITGWWEHSLSPYFLDTLAHLAGWGLLVVPPTPECTVVAAAHHFTDAWPWTPSAVVFGLTAHVHFLPGGFHPLPAPTPEELQPNPWPRGHPRHAPPPCHQSQLLPPKPTIHWKKKKAQPRSWGLYFILWTFWGLQAQR